MKKIPMPNGLDKQTILNLLQEEYGTLPPAPEGLTATVTSCAEDSFANKAIQKSVTLQGTVEGKAFSFPISFIQRKSEKPTPCFVHINFRPDIPDIYQPTEELVDNGYSVLSFNYTDVSSDDGDFTNGLAGVVYPEGKRSETQCGKIGLWAWAAMRVVDYALTLPEIRKDRITVVGHSRLGKTALLTGALDERLYCAVSNDSGCSGAAISRDKRGETIEAICRVFPFWFAESYTKYANHEDDMPFDQHFLLAANVPHRVYVCSAEEDIWADPLKEYEGCLLAEPYYRDHGFTTYLPEVMPDIGTPIDRGAIGYHVRSGSHYLSREDWQYFIQYLAKSEA